MSESQSLSSTPASSATTSTSVSDRAPSAPAVEEYGPLHTEFGNTTIAEQVVAKVAGIAAREVDGVHSMGTAVRRAFNTLSDRIQGGGQQSVTGGVSVAKGERQTAIDISIIVEYGVSIVAVSENIRHNIINAVEHATGLEVTQVNIDVTDVHLPDLDAADGSTGQPVPAGRELS